MNKKYKDNTLDLTIESYHNYNPLLGGDTNIVNSIMTLWNNNFTYSPSIVLDVGACVGIYSLLLSRIINNKDCRIYSFEPVKSSYETMVKNISINKINNIIPLNYGILDKNTEVTLGLPESSEIKNNITLNYPGRYSIHLKRDSVLAKFKRLKEFSKEYNIQGGDIIKLDCEGCEELFLKDNKEFIRNSKLLFIERTHEGTSLNNIVNTLEQCGFKEIWTSRHDFSFINIKKIEEDK